MLKEINDYIYENCVCDGMGPLDAMHDSGNFEGLTDKDLANIQKMLLPNDNEANNNKSNKHRRKDEHRRKDNRDKYRNHK